MLDMVSLTLPDSADSILLLWLYVEGNGRTGLIPITEFGQEKTESLAGLSDKEIEERVTGLVKTGI